jgi:hypothetical protein
VTGVEEGAVFDSFDRGLGGGFFGGDYLCLCERDGFREICVNCVFFGITNEAEVQRNS